MTLLLLFYACTATAALVVIAECRLIAAYAHAATRLCRSGCGQGPWCQRFEVKKFSELVFDFDI